MGQLANKCVIVTGAANPLGRAAATRVLQEGAQVMLMDGDASTLAQTAKEIGSSVRYMQVATQADALARAVERAAAELGALYGLVNVLHETSEWKPFTEKTDAEFAFMLNDVRAIAGAMRAAHPFLKRSQGRVVNVSSAYGATSFAHISDTVTADYALQGLTRSVGVEWAQDGVLVNHIVPGALDLPSFREFRDRHAQQTDALVHGLALQRVGDPCEDFGGALMFLLSDEACFLVGHTVYADGGQHLVAPVFEPGADARAT